MSKLLQCCHMHVICVQHQLTTLPYSLTVSNKLVRGAAGQSAYKQLQLPHRRTDSADPEFMSAAIQIIHSSLQQANHPRCSGVIHPARLQETILFNNHTHSSQQVMAYHVTRRP